MGLGWTHAANLANQSVGRNRVQRRPGGEDDQAPPEAATNPPLTLASIDLCFNWSRSAALCVVVAKSRPTRQEAGRRYCFVGLRPGE